ncbi:MAG TPA: hypothetical protein VF545_03110 [Thermoleophilaceae bacterium]|jgi:hypothetical protein
MARIRCLFAASALVAVTAVTLSSPTQAHNRCVYHGADVACVFDDHSSIAVCDRERDGHYVRAQYHLYFNPARQYGPWDRSGADYPCSRRRHSPGAITWFRLCEVHAGCSRWKKA